MKKIIVFGSKHWSGCEPMKEFLSENEVKYAYLDITENMLNLKLFLKYRDNASEFRTVKEEGRVGVPCVIINDGEQIIFEQKDLVIGDLKK